MKALPLHHSVAGQPVLVMGQGDAAESKRLIVARAGGLVLDDPAEAADKGARLAFVALEDGSACEAAAIRLRCAGLLVNVVDRPDLCDFTVPSILERGPVTISVGTGGVSAGFAKALRLRLESLLPPALGDLASALGAARDAMKARWPDPRSRRQAMDAALAPGGALDLMNAQSASRIAQFIEEGADPAAGDRTVEIALQSGDPDDLTIAQARLMGSADTIVHDEKVPLAVLNRARADAIRLPARDDIPVRPGLTIRLTYP